MQVIVGRVHYYHVTTAYTPSFAATMSRPTLLPYMRYMMMIPIEYDHGPAVNHVTLTKELGDAHRTESQLPIQRVLSHFDFIHLPDCYFVCRTRRRSFLPT